MPFLVLGASGFCIEKCVCVLYMDRGEKVEKRNIFQSAVQ